MDGIEWTASAMQTARARLEIAARNLANASTDGFRKTVARITLTAKGLVARESVSHEQGALRHTGRALDLAIAGEGSFVVGGEPTRKAISPTTAAGACKARTASCASRPRASCSTEFPCRIARAWSAASSKVP